MENGFVGLKKSYDERIDSSGFGRIPNHAARTGRNRRRGGTVRGQGPAVPFGGAAPDRRGGVPDFPPQQADVANLPRQPHPALHDDRRENTLSGKGFVEAVVDNYVAGVSLTPK